MELLTDRNWKSVYRSGDDNLLVDFYKPVLSIAAKYDRAVGFFSADLLLSNLQGISSLVMRAGKMRLIIGDPLSEMEFRAVQHGHNIAGALERLNERLMEVIEKAKEQSVDRLEILAWLIAADKLEIKFALRKQGMYHEKLGIIYDQEDNMVVFQGSANETIYAMDSDFNAESIMVFPSWDRNTFEQYGQPCVDGFEKLWSGKQMNTLTVDIPSSFYSKIQNAYPNPRPPSPSDEDGDSRKYHEFFLDSNDAFEPKVPSHFKESAFELFEHQNVAISKWWTTNNHMGILKLATGAGKTVTSIYAAVRIFEAKKKLNQRFFLIVAVPYKELAAQWVLDLSRFNIFPHRCYDSRNSWFDALSKDIFSYQMNGIDFLSVVVVNKTLASETFRDCIRPIKSEQMMFIGDECHHHGSKRFSEFLPNADFRLGLSATPFRSDDDEYDSPFPDDAKDRLIQYYKGIVNEYSLSDAINDGILCEYDYHIVPLNLTAEEQAVFDELSGEIARIVARRFSGGISTKEQSRLTILCGQRSRLLGTATNKLVELEKMVKRVEPENRNLTLFYCGEGRVFNADEIGDDEKIVEKVSRVLGQSNWISSRFTSGENAKTRKSIMKSFKEKEIDAIVSMRVLDEGIDVPTCNTAYLLSSTKNPRQYVQRRGRVLRKAPGKTKADIFDFIVLPCAGSNSTASQRLIMSEMERVQEFKSLASNKYDLELHITELGLNDE
jgi:superfamily II DNA or RNA helicase